MTELETQLYIALKAMPCRCQMAGGSKWHFKAQTITEKQCSRCAAIAAYDSQSDTEGDKA